MKKYAASTLLAAGMTSDPEDPSNKPESTGDLDTNTSAAISDCVKFLQDREFIRLQKVKSNGKFALKRDLKWLNKLICQHYRIK